MYISEHLERVLVILVAILFLFPLAVYAHGGGTDENGGHYDHSTGEYHYHHGFPAHQHGEDGSCPYEGQGPYYEEHENDEPYDSEDDLELDDDSYYEGEYAVKEKNSSGGDIPWALIGIGAAVLILGLEFFGDALFPAQQSAKNESTESNSHTYYCPYCGAPMVLRNGKYGPFYGCSRYPECYGTRNINGRAKKKRKKR